MHLKQKGYRFGVLLIYAITTLTLPSAGWCRPALSPSALSDDRSSVSTTRADAHPSSRGGGRRRLSLSSRKSGELRNLPNFDHLENTDGSQTSGGRPEQTLGPRMASASTDESFKNRVSPKRTDEGSTYASRHPSNEDCRKGEIKPVIHGSFYITGQLETNAPNLGYQSDPAVSGQERIRGQWVRASEESWQRLQPVVECGEYAMTLTVRRRRAVQLLLDRVNESSVPLSQLPPQCGYSVKTTWRDLSLMAHYDACHVTQEDDSYVLPLLWRGTPVTMSCPASQSQSQAVGLHSSTSLCCSLYGMTVKVQGLSATEELRVNVRGEWTPLEVLAEQCGYTLRRKDAEVVITAPFIACGITVKDGKCTLSLQIGEKTFALACSVSPPGELPLTHQPLVNSPHHLTRGPTEHMPESLEPFPWAPPFYLAPPYYPHPTYHHKYPSPDGQDAYNSPAPSSSTPDPTFGPSPLPSVDSKTDYQNYNSYPTPVMESYKHFAVHGSLSFTDEMEDSSWMYPDLQQRQETPVLSLSEKRSATHSPSSGTGFPSQVEAPPLQPPSHGVNQYYHYYHHPKIPLPDPPQDTDPDPDFPPSTNPLDPEFPVLPPSIQQLEALSRVNVDQFLQPVPAAASHAYTLPTSAPHTPYPQQPYPYHYFYYFPHIARGEAKRSAPLNPDMTAKTNLTDYQNTESGTFVHPLIIHSSGVHDYTLNPYIDQPNADKMIQFQRNSPEWIKHPLLSDEDGVKAELEPPGPDAVAVPPPEQSSLPTPSPNHNVPLYPYNYYPYYHYFQMYYGPESLLSCDNPVSPTSSKETLDPLLQTSSSPLQHQSYHKPQTPPKKSMDDVHHGPLHPYYYYYHLYYQPKVSVDNQEVHPAGSMNSKSESQLPSHSDYSQMGWLVHAAETGYPSMPQSSPFHSIYPHDISQQQPYDPFGHPNGDEAEGLDDEMKDHHKTNPYTPSASPCGPGPVSDFDCCVVSGCCSYPEKDCTMGQHLIFTVPDPVVEPTAAPLAHHSEVSNVSCTLQCLTSDPDIYIVPLDGCGVNKHVFGQTVVHLLEVHGLQSVHENSSVRLMVECSSLPGSPGEGRLNVMDQLPPPAVQSTPATVTVQLRIATDESFTSFHPEAHLPLSIMRGRPLYVEVRLLDPPEPDLVLLVHSCLAYTQAPHTSWMLIYDGCPSQGYSQLLPSPCSHHIRRMMISSFLSLTSESPTYVANGGYSHLEDPEVFFLCLTEVCSGADSDCTVGCINSSPHWKRKGENEE